MSVASDPWGRVADDGTVYVRTAQGERAVGSWQAGSPDEALAFFQRKFESLRTEVSLLEQRIATTDLPAAQAQATISRLAEAVTSAHAVGDLDSLRSRLERLTEAVDKRREEHRAAREQARTEAIEVRERIVAEAERIAAEATHWKAGGERMRALLEEWKASPRGDRAAETALWKRLSAARNAFAKRRKTYFAHLEVDRDAVRARKEKLISEAEALATATDWGPTAAAFRELMRAWKEAGRADRASEESLWQRFKAAQDAFFSARAAAVSAKDARLSEHALAKEQLLTEAEKLLPVTDARAARAALRVISEKWEQAGPVPRAAADRLEGGLRRVEDAIRQAEQAHWQRSSPEALSRARSTVDQLRATISQLEDRLAAASQRGDDSEARQITEALTARRSWLAEAERTLAELSG